MSLAAVWPGPWADRGRCVGLDPELFFPVRGEDDRTAKEVCRDCPVRPECREHGIRHEIHGIWGGLSGRERRAIRLDRRRKTMGEVA
jgi:WhiB family redox-sensing transcriptional regulator